MNYIDHIDIGDFFSSKDTSILEARVAESIIKDGAVSVTGFPKCEKISQYLTCLRSFFDLSDADKRILAVKAYEKANKNIYRGYNPLPKTQGHNYNETFDVGPEPHLPAPELLSKSAFEEQNIWPDEKQLKGWRDNALEYKRICKTVAGRIIIALANRLDGPSELAEKFCKSKNHTLRLLNYPTLPKDFRFTEPQVVDEATGLSLVGRQHIDTGLLTILWQSESGLQMLGRDKIWRNVPVKENSVSIHCGDILQMIGGDSLEATPHRVWGGKGQRFSAGYFLEPEWFDQIFPPKKNYDLKSYAQHLTDSFPTRFLADR